MDCYTKLGVRVLPTLRRQNLNKENNAFYIGNYMRLSAMLPCTLLGPIIFPCTGSTQPPSSSPSGVFPLLASMVLMNSFL